MSKLTESEQVAYDWMKEEGFRDIEKRGKNGYPDFLADGEWIEVKKVSSIGTIAFTKKQLKIFCLLYPTIILTDSGSVDSVIKFNSLRRSGYKSSLDRHLENSASPKPIVCENCGYEWEYKGELEHTTCPNCNRKTRVVRK